MRNNLIIARYNEDLNWLKDWIKLFDIIVYNKGQDDIDKLFYSVKLPNIGREAHTYLYHIVENYDNLGDNNVFLQGTIDNLGPNVYLNLNLYLETLKTSNYCANSIGHVCGPYYNDIDFMADPMYRDQVKSNFLRISDIKFKDYILKYFNYLPPCIPMSMKGCFGVTKKAIQARPKQFYVDLLNSIPEYHTVEEAHFLERLWAFMFLEKK